MVPKSAIIQLSINTATGAKSLTPFESMERILKDSFPGNANAHNRLCDTQLILLSDTLKLEY